MGLSNTGFAEVYVCVPTIRSEGLGNIMGYVEVIAMFSVCLSIKV